MPSKFACFFCSTPASPSPQRKRTRDGNPIPITLTEAKAQWEKLQKGKLKTIRQVQTFLREIWQRLTPTDRGIFFQSLPTFITVNTASSPKQKEHKESLSSMQILLRDGTSEDFEIIWTLHKSCNASLPMLKKPKFLPTKKEYWEELLSTNHHDLFLLLCSEPDILKRQDQDGNTLLHHAALMKDELLVSLISHTPLDSVDFTITNNKGETPLHLTAEYLDCKDPAFWDFMQAAHQNKFDFSTPNDQNLTVLQILMRGEKLEPLDDQELLSCLGALENYFTKPAILQTKYQDGETILHRAVSKKRSAEVLQQLTTISNVGIKNAVDEDTPLHLAAKLWDGKNPSFYALIDAAAQSEFDFSTQNGHGLTVFHLLAQNEALNRLTAPELVKCWKTVQRYGDINVLSEENAIPLFCATERLHLNTLHALMVCDADPATYGNPACDPIERISQEIQEKELLLRARETEPDQLSEEERQQLRSFYPPNSTFSSFMAETNSRQEHINRSMTTLQTLHKEMEEKAATKIISDFHTFIQARTTPQPSLLHYYSQYLKSDDAKKQPLKENINRLHQILTVYIAAKKCIKNLGYMSNLETLCSHNRTPIIHARTQSNYSTERRTPQNLAKFLEKSLTDDRTDDIEQMVRKLLSLLERDGSSLKKPQRSITYTELAPLDGRSVSRAPSVTSSFAL